MCAFSQRPCVLDIRVGTQMDRRVRSSAISARGRTASMTTRPTMVISFAYCGNLHFI